MPSYGGMTTSFQFSEAEEIAKAPELCQLKPVTTRFGHHGTVSTKETWSVAFTPDHSYFAWSSGKGIVRLVPWMRELNAYDASALNLFINNNNRRPSDFSEDRLLKHSRVIEYVCNSNVWSLAFGSSIPHKKLTNRQVGYRHYQHLDGDDILLLAVGLQSGAIMIFNVFKKEKFSLIDHKQVVRNLAFAPDGSLTLVSACRDHTLKVWDVKDDGNMVHTMRGHKGWVHDCAFSPDASHMASVGTRGEVFIWDMSNFRTIRKLSGHYHDAVACQYTPDGAVLLTASWDARAIAWDPSTGQMLSEYHHVYPPMDPVFAGGANNSFTRGISVSPNGQHFATICDDGYVRIWSLLNNSDPLAIASLEEAVSCCFSPNGMVVAVGTRSGQVSFFAVHTNGDTIPTLQHLCRMVIRKLVPDTNLILKELKAGCLLRYLTYQQME